MARYDNFYTRVLKNPGDGCWQWCGPKNNKGYGYTYIRELGRRMTTHRASYTLRYGEIPEGLWVLHRCDNPACVKPSHLFLGSPKDNVHDMIAKGRANRGNRPKGENHAYSKLSDATIIAIRTDYVAGVSIDRICEAYSVSRNSIHDYTGGRSWKHLLGVNGAPNLTQLKAECKRRAKSNAKLDQAKAEQIRARLSAGELNKDLASEFGVSTATISDIRLRRIWA
jgi:transposase